jgi:iron complex outermembrane receptor protein
MFKRKATSTAVLIALGAAVAVPAFAQEKLDRVEVTGSAIKRLEAEGALPVTVVKTEDLVKQGVTSTEQALSRVAAIQSNFGASASIGGTTGGKAEADLRGLSGPTAGNANKTLVLLNGRRLANHAFDAAAVDLNAIPFAAIDRIEVLRDGASSIYGSDAIGGVINFITKRDFVGLEASVQAIEPNRSGGGDTQRANVTAGFGSLSKHGFNVSATLDWRKQNVLAAIERNFSRTGVVNGAITPGTSGTSFPGDVGGFEPSLPNCAPPLSIPNEAGTSCRYDFSGAIDIIPQNEQRTALLKGVVQVAPDHLLELEYLNSNNKAISRVAAVPTTSVILQSSPFWPAGATPQRDADGNLRDFNPNVAGVQPGSAVNWRTVPAGKRTSGDDTTSERAMAAMQGLLAGWDYKAAVGQAKNKSTASVKGGYVNDAMINAGVLAGTINPLGEQTAGGLAAIEAAQVREDTQIGTNKVTFVDVSASKEVFSMAGGAAILALGLEFRNERSSVEALPITAELGSLGIDPDSDTAGKRKLSAGFMELNLPLAKNLDLSLAGRYDRYSDVGNSFNPKVGIRWQPSKNILVRGSANTGFRAPTLYEIYAPQALSFTTDNYDDPLLCPGGVPVAGASEGAVCGQQVLSRAVGPVANGQASNALSPEKSKAFTLGLGFQITPELTAGFDVWDLRIRNLIAGLPEQQIFGNAARYASRFVRCSQLPAGPDPRAIDRGDVDVCTNYPSFDPIAYIDQPTENLGELRTSGIDIDVNWRSRPTGFGRFNASVNGTYVMKYDYQREKNGAFIDAVGRYSDNAPVFRWQHVATLGWQMDSWSATLGQRHKSGYTDQGGAAKVKAYTLYDLSVTWAGIKNLSLTGAVTNLFDKDPPVSGQTTTFQRGYDPRFTDPLGRAVMLRANYKFW